MRFEYHVGKCKMLKTCSVPNLRVGLMSILTMNVKQRSKIYQPYAYALGVVDTI